MQKPTPKTNSRVQFTPIQRNRTNQVVTFVRHYTGIKVENAQQGRVSKGAITSLCGNSFSTMRCHAEIQMTCKCHYAEDKFDLR